MCGIAGSLVAADAGPVPLEELRRMVALLRHRGPDGYGLYRDERAALGHTRLSIIDPAGGDQPIHNEDESVWVSFNGEIFNYIELRAELEGLGHRFYTRSDTEVIVHSYEQYGERAWGRFNGQFAIALWDRRARRLWLVRDRFGILPLHYARLADRVLFASEVKALFASERMSPRFDARGLAQVFARWAATPPSTVFADVRSVPPGTALRFDDALRATAACYWRPDLAPDARLAAAPAAELAETLDHLLRRAVKLRLRADVPVGAYLSGGLDSSLIAWLIATLDDTPLATFAVRFEDPRFDETAQQRRMARLLASAHHETLCRNEDIGAALPELVWHAETPLLRTAPAPLYLLSGLVRARGMKVVLTGEGADELLAGYNIFKEDKVRRFWARRPESRIRPALLSRLYGYVGDGQQHTRLWQRFFRRGLTELEHPFYSHRVRWENTAWSLRFLAPRVCSAAAADEPQAALAGALPAGWRAWPPLARAQAIEIATFFSPYLLCSQGDRVAMAHGVEVRYPFLDPEVVDYCLRLPARFKLCGLRDKLVLRRAASRYLPGDVWRRPKQPYRAPLAAALLGTRADSYLWEVLSRPYLERFGLLDTAAVTRLVARARRNKDRMLGEREEMALVGVLTLQLLAYWYLERFASRAAQCRAALDRAAPRVAVDRVGPARGPRGAGRSVCRPGRTGV